MNDQDRKARELLADEYERDGRTEVAEAIRNNTLDDFDTAGIRAIRRALDLAAPEGFSSVDLSAFLPAVKMWRAWSELGIDCTKVGPLSFKHSEKEYQRRVTEADRLLALIAAAPKPAATEGNGGAELPEPAFILRYEDAAFTEIAPASHLYSQEQMLAFRSQGTTADIYEAYKSWPADLRKKLSMHDLRRMTGWAPAKPAADGVTEAEVLAAGRALSDRAADAFKIDREDNWKTYSHEFIGDGRAALAAARKGEGNG